MLGWNVTRPVDLIKGIIVSDITIRFKNWDKYNKRQKDIKRPYWFAMSNDIFMDPFYVELSDQERQAFIWLLCEASRQNKYGEVEISSRIFVQITGYKRSVLASTLDKLLKSGRAAGSRQDAGGIATATEQNRTEQDRTEQDKTEQNTRSERSEIVFPDGVAELESLWLSRSVKPNQLEAMLEAFPEPNWLMREARKAVAWEEANPTRRKKDFARFLNNWLSRAWDSRKVPGSYQQRANDGEAREAQNALAAKEALRLLGIK